MIYTLLSSIFGETVCYDALCMWVQSTSSSWKIWEKKGWLSSLLYLKCPTSSCRYVSEFFTLAKINRGFGINQQIVMRSLGHGYAGTEKFNTLMNIPKPMTINIYNKTVSKISDVANFVDVVYQRYWDKKIRVCWVLSKTCGNPVTKPKEKRKRTRLKVRGVSYRCHKWSTAKLCRCSYSSNCWELEKYEIKFFSFLVSCCFK